MVFTKAPDTKMSWGFAFITGCTYNIHFGRGIDYWFLPFRAGPDWTSSDKVILNFNYTDYRETFDVKMDVPGQEISTKNAS
mmetsp:Transcript_115129/g.172084  ORF Transcript_115129/g.172084 Transcript_115129/m.172084 type:complete len:81 (+) Transcript_115129:67-309(+)